MWTFEEALGKTSDNAALVNEILTHSSRAKETGRKSNERLAHLGDAVLELAVRQALFKRSPRIETKGELTDEKRKFVNNAALAAIAADWPKPDGNLGWPLSKKKVMAEVFEAVVGAVYVDSNYNFPAAAAVALSLVGLSETSAGFGQSAGTLDG